MKAVNKCRANDIQGRSLLFNWAVVGWCVGVIEGANGDGRRKMGGEVINFFVHYEVDGDTSAHVLKLETYGGEGEGSWVLLEDKEERNSFPLGQSSDPAVSMAGRTLHDRCCAVPDSIFVLYAVYPLCCVCVRVRGLPPLSCVRTLFTPSVSWLTSRPRELRDEVCPC